MGLSGVEPLTSRLSGGETQGSDSGKFSDFKAIPHDLHGIEEQLSEALTVRTGTGSGTTFQGASLGPMLVVRPHGAPRGDLDDTAILPNDEREAQLSVTPHNTLLCCHDGFIYRGPVSDDRGDVFPATVAHPSSPPIRRRVWTSRMRRAAFLLPHVLDAC
jgi:hypothetical protein